MALGALRLGGEEKLFTARLGGAELRLSLANLVITRIERGDSAHEIRQRQNDVVHVDRGALAGKSTGKAGGIGGILSETLKHRRLVVIGQSHFHRVVAEHRDSGMFLQRLDGEIRPGDSRVVGGIGNAGGAARRFLAGRTGRYAVPIGEGQMLQMT